MKPAVRQVVLAFLTCCVLNSFADTHYVNLINPGPESPYLTWDTAATNIQDAITAAAPGDVVLVTNGIYQVGGRPVPPSLLTNRVVVSKPIALRSVNGPGVTWIVGSKVSGSILGVGAVRCVYLTNDAVLDGFTLTNGATQDPAGAGLDDTGGGVYCASSSCSVTNCVLIGNAAAYGGAVIYGTLDHCVLSENICSAQFGDTSWGGGAYMSTLNYCSLTNNTNAAVFSTLNNCVLSGNVAGPIGVAAAYYCDFNDCTILGSSGRGTWRGTLTNCLLAGNNGDTCSGSTLYNCTVVSNTSGLYDCAAFNCIAYYNDASGGNNFVSDGELGNGSMNHCCTTPDPGGTGNITNSPLFVSAAGGDFHLQGSSPCINAGDNSYVGTLSDRDGNTRISGGTVDLGCYEFQNPASTISYAWLLQFGLAIDGSADRADTDSDGMNNWQEWIAGTNPTNAVSALRMLSVSNDVSGAIVSWESVEGINYYLQRSATAGPAGFSSIQSNIVGQAGTTSYTDTNAVGLPALIYRVGIQ